MKRKIVFENLVDSLTGLPIEVDLPANFNEENFKEMCDIIERAAENSAFSLLRLINPGMKITKPKRGEINYECG